MATEAYIDVPMDETMIAATLIALEQTIANCTRTRDEICAFVMARQKQQGQGGSMMLGELQAADAAAAAAGAVERHMTDLDPPSGSDNL